jgi:pilus assembly protein CpaF
MSAGFGRRHGLGAQPILVAADERAIIRDQVLSRIEPSAAVHMTRAELAERVNRLVAQIANDRRLLLNQHEQQTIGSDIVDDMVGLGPIEVLLHDETVSDILVNGPHSIYVERSGKLQLTGLSFRNDAHVLHVAQRIASAAGRRVDESSPMLDARLADGSRVNVVMPPLSIRGCCISIRRFSRKPMELDALLGAGTLSPDLASVLRIAAQCRLNILVSGGTGAGKTTLLNALSAEIDHGERIVTIEDAAELRLRQPHVVQLETRQQNIEGHGQVTQRDLVRNALRMRPDRIIIGEVRGVEAFDMMQAMNTGHNGSMSTVHANSAQDALARIENMILMADMNLPVRAIRGQIASALDLAIHIERMRDGARRIIEVAAIVGLRADAVALEPVFGYRYAGENADGSLRGTFEPSGARPRFLSRLAYYGLADRYLEVAGTTA